MEMEELNCIFISLRYARPIEEELEKETSEVSREPLSVLDSW